MNIDSKSRGTCANILTDIVSVGFENLKNSKIWRPPPPNIKDTSHIGRKLCNSLKFMKIRELHTLRSWSTFSAPPPIQKISIKKKLNKISQKTLNIPQILNIRARIPIDSLKF